MDALITSEADSMSALRFRMCKADEALWFDMTCQGISEGRKHGRYRAVVQACILHSCESWSWTKELADTIDGWESRNLEIPLRDQKEDQFGTHSSKPDSDGEQEICKEWW